MRQTKKNMKSQVYNPVFIHLQKSQSRSDKYYVGSGEIDILYTRKTG